ncbi:MAG: hypothetical protein L0154_25555, partial [Chloroflexi bacterium]|nr:hypothetical protein [Chloroflexota bacterium]
DVPPALQAYLREHWGAFLLGSIAADGQHESNLKREDTHFFTYRDPIEISPATIMLQRYPELQANLIMDQEHLVFIAGYIGHLKMDEIWWRDFSFPNFGGKDWAEWPQRLFMLHALLAIVDERDYQALQDDVYPALTSPQPADWLPFLEDRAIAAWRDNIAAQIAPAGQSLTIEVLGSRVKQGVNELRNVLNDPARLETDLWAYVPRTLLEDIEQRMYEEMREAVIQYLDYTG